MSTELNLVSELAVILIAAAVFTVISKALRQPLILGYILAGFIVGPHLGLFPQFSPQSVHEWAELGIIFLLFGLGLEFNFKKLLNVGSAAIITALTISLGMLAVGFVTGSAFGWAPIQCLFFGGMLGMSSTTIIIKAYDDLGYKNKPYATLVFGLLVVEDLLAVLIMVLFSTLAVSNKFSGIDMLVSLAKLVTFLVLCFLVGIFVIPTVFKRWSKYISDEILLLISVGLCFILVMLANYVGFSSALGAFLIGSILSSTVEGERIEQLIGHIKSFFGAIFFVSVGMMVNPAVIAEYWSMIIIITLVAMAGILVFSTVGVLVAGKGLDTALHVGFSLPQLGEFSFIIAALGCSMGVVDDYLYPVIISVSVITTFTTPYMIKAADPVSAWMHKVLPSAVLGKLNSKVQEDATSRAETNLWRVFIKKYLTRVSLYSMILLVILLGLEAISPTISEWLLNRMNGTLARVIEVIVTLLLISPFLFGLAINRGDLRALSESLVKKAPRAKIPIMVSIIFRMVLAVIFTLSAIMIYSQLSGWRTIAVVFGIFFVFIMARRNSADYTKLEQRFMTNLNAKETLLKSRTPVAATFRARMAGYDIHTMEIPVLPDFKYSGKTLREMPFRGISGVNIAKIQRGSKSIIIPGGGEVIYPGDRLVAVGNTAQLESFARYMAASYDTAEPDSEEFVVEPVSVDDGDTIFAGKELCETNLRAAGCLLVSVERDGAVFANPDKKFKFAPGDILWIAGLKSSVEWLKK